MSGQPTILLLHGARSSRSTWWRVGADLADVGWRVLTVDLLGHGGRVGPRTATVETLANDVLEQVHGQRVDLIVGHSLGAIVALTVVRLRSGRVRGVVLEEPPASDQGVDRETLAASLEADVARARERPDEAIAALVAEHPGWAWGDAQRAVRSRGALDLEQVAAFLREHRWDLPALVAASPVPVQLLAATGPETALVGPDRAALLATLAPERVTAMAGGHSLHRDRPGLWLYAVLAFAAALGLDSGSPPATA